MGTLDNMKYIIEGLRNKPIPAGVENVNGRPRRMAGSSPLKSTNDDVNYTRYVRQQSQVGESPVTYEEWLRK